MGLFDAFFGDSQRDDIAAANTQATEELRQGTQRSIRERRNALDSSLGFLQPDIDAGAGARDQLVAALGGGGADAQRSFFNDFQVDPQFQAETDAGLDAAQDSAAAQGNLFSGGTLKGLTGFAAQRRGDAFNNRLQQLFRLSGVGSNAAGASAGMTQQTGSNIADTQFGAGQLGANQAINFGNAQAASRSIPINNLLGIANIGAKAAGAGFGGGF